MLMIAHLLTIELVDDLVKEEDTTEELDDFDIDELEDFSSIALAAVVEFVDEYLLLEYRSWLLNNSVALKFDLC